MEKHKRQMWTSLDITGKTPIVHNQIIGEGEIVVYKMPDGGYPSYFVLVLHPALAHFDICEPLSGLDCSRTTIATLDRRISTYTHK